MNRVVIGQRGSELGLWASKPGFDVMTATPDQLLMDMTYKSEQVIQHGLVSTPGTVVALGLSVAPLVILYCVSGSQFGTGVIRPFPNFTSTSRFNFVSVTPASFTFSYSGTTGGSAPYRYFVMRRALP